MLASPFSPQQLSRHCPVVVSPVNSPGVALLPFAEGAQKVLICSDASSATTLSPSDSGLRFVEGYRAVRRVSSPYPGSALVRTCGSDGRQCAHRALSPSTGCSTAWSNPLAMSQTARCSSPGPARCSLPCSALGSVRCPAEPVLQQCCQRPFFDSVALQAQQHSRPMPEASGSPLSMPASPQGLPFRESLQQNVPCNMTSTLGHRTPVPMAISGPMPRARSNSRDRPVHLQDRQRQDVTPLCPQPPAWLQMQDAHLRALHEELQACHMAVQAEALERSNAVAQVECTLKAILLAETEERKAEIGALNAELRVTNAQLHDMGKAFEREHEMAQAQPTSTDFSPHPQVASKLGTGGPAFTAPAVAAEAGTEAEADAHVHHPVPPPQPVLVDELAMTVAELHTDLINDLKGTLKMQFRQMQQELWHALEHEMSERKEFENRTIHSFETLKESHQSSIDDMQEDLAKRARERAQKAWEQFASNPVATTLPADMGEQAAASATYMCDTVPVAPLLGNKHSQHPAQAPIQETVHQSSQQFVRMKETHASSGGDGAAGPQHPLDLKAQTVHSVQLKCTAEALVPYQDDSSVRGLARFASDQSSQPTQLGEALNLEAQVALDSSFTDNSDVPKDKSWKARYQEINERIDSGSLNQVEAVELALRALSVEEAPGALRSIDLDESPRTSFFSNTTGRSSVLPETDNSTSESGGFVSGQVQTPNRYLLRRSIHDGPEVTATAEASP